jgi:hypothetical protein
VEPALEMAPGVWFVWIVARARHDGCILPEVSRDIRTQIGVEWSDHERRDEFTQQA